jgi:hypothetical protein
MEADGPLQAEIRGIIKDVLAIEILEAQFAGREDLDTGQAFKLTLEWLRALSQCVLRLAEKVDELEGV